MAQLLWLVHAGKQAISVKQADQETTSSHRVLTALGDGEEARDGTSAISRWGRHGGLHQDVEGPGQESNGNGPVVGARVRNFGSNREEGHGGRRTEQVNVEQLRAQIGGRPTDGVHRARVELSIEGRVGHRDAADCKPSECEWEEIEWGRERNVDDVPGRQGQLPSIELSARVHEAHAAQVPGVKSRN